MKKILITLLIPFIVFGQVITNETTSGGYYKIVFSWTAGSGGSTTGATSSRYTGAIGRVVFDPKTPAPRDNYDVLLKDQAAYDILDGNGANLDSILTTQINTQFGSIVNSKLTLAVSNAGSGGAGTITVYVIPAQSVADSSISTSKLDQTVYDYMAGYVDGVTAGSGLSGGGTSGTVSLAVSGLTNSHIDAAAAIAGTKISPDFGSQDIKTTGKIGANVSSPEGVVHAAYSTETYLPISQRTGQTANSPWNTHKFLATKTDNMSDGFGSVVSFYIEDDAAVKNKIAMLGAIRAGADNTGDIGLYPLTAGAQTRIFKFTNTAKFGNVSSPGAFLDIRGTEGLDGTFYLSADDGDDAADKWTQKVSASTNNFSLASSTKTIFDINHTTGETDVDIDADDIYKGMTVGKAYAIAHGTTYGIARAIGAYSFDTQYCTGLFGQSFGAYNGTTKLGNIGLYGAAKTAVDFAAIGMGGAEWWAAYNKFSVYPTGRVGIGIFGTLQTPDAHLHVDGVADEVQLAVDGHSSQTANLQEWRTSAESPVASMSPSGGLTANTVRIKTGAVIDSVKVDGANLVFYVGGTAYKAVP